MYLLKVLIKTDYNWQSNIFLDLNILQGQGVGKTSLSAALNLILLNNTDWGHFSQTNEFFHFKYFTYLFHVFVFVASNIMESNYWGPLFQFTLAHTSYGGQTGDLQPLLFTSQPIQEDMCRDCPWGPTVSEGSVHQATVHAQRRSQAAVWDQLCPCRPCQQTSIFL